MGSAYMGRGLVLQKFTIKAEKPYIRNAIWGLKVMKQTFKRSCASLTGSILALMSIVNFQGHTKWQIRTPLTKVIILWDTSTWDLSIYI